MITSMLRPVVVASAVVLGFTSVVLAHGHSEDGKPNEAIARPDILSSPTNSTVAESYFQYGGHFGLMLAHIVLMTIAWVFVLPIGVMLSIARSRYCLLVQFGFLTINASGVLLVTIYNASTPDLYPNNAHHKLGWVLTCIMSAQLVMGILSAYSKPKEQTFMQVSTEAMADHQRMHPLRSTESYRFSNDSGHGTEPNTESLRSQSISLSDDTAFDSQLPDALESHELDDEKKSLNHGSKVDKFLSQKLEGMLPSRILLSVRFVYNTIDRLILILGFVGVSTGIVTYGGLFKGPEVFSGLAHFIKGGVFFWYGILTLGRWAGCFADIGWAWNVTPTRTSRPTAESVESFLIFFYGSTNVFLEHLAAWGSEWSAQDLEHISISIMFIGGGLCGMLIESRKTRDLLNVTKQPTTKMQRQKTFPMEEPKSYRVSMNPIPALVVLLLGLLMSSHHQDSMVSTMIHAQWGTLLVGAAFARAATYVVFYLSPPTSVLPGRPPTELITAFCLMSGGMIFMASASDVVASLELHDLDAMFFFTVSMGVITFLMAWIILVIAMKGWAFRRENRFAF